MKHLMEVAFDVLMALFMLGALSAIVCGIVYIVKRIKYNLRKQKATLILFVISLIIAVCSYIIAVVIDNQYMATYNCFMDGHMIVE